MPRIWKLAAIAAFAAMPMSAFAATVTAVFNSQPNAPGAVGTTWTHPDKFITVTSEGQGEIYLGGSALGVRRAGESPALNSQLNTGETLRFSFSALVTSVTIQRSPGTFPVILTSYDANGNVVYAPASNTWAFPSSMPSATVINGPSNTPILSFLLQGVSGTGAGIRSITYTTADLPDPAPVPLPAAGWLLLGCVGALAGLRRRNARTAA